MPWVPLAKGATSAVRKGIRAYHGSPHDFDRFSMDKIGSGEGAQAYGHGLYFAENEGVAGQYRDQLSSKYPVSHSGVIEEDGKYKAWAKSIDAENVKIIHEDDTQSGAKKALKQYLDGKQGRMYEVNINANPEDFLDWDKPLRDQPEPIRQMALDRIMVRGPSGEMVPARQVAEQWERGGLDIWDKDRGMGELRLLSGQDLYHALRLGAPDDVVDGKAAWDGSKALRAPPKEFSTQQLRQAGIPGIRYLDQGSRGAGDGSRNYVVFDENLIEIVRKYGIAGAVGLGLLSAEQAEAMESAGVEEQLAREPKKGEMLVSQHDRPDPSFWESTKAALQRENIIGSTVSSQRFNMGNEEFFAIDDNYNPFEDEDMKGFADSEEHEYRFVEVFNKKAAEAVKADILREQENQRILDASGWTGVGLQMGAAIADPTILMPGGALIRAGRLGYSAGRSGLNVGIAGGLAVGTQEAGLQATQQTRTGEETAMNIAGGAILSGLFGAGIAKFMTRADIKKFSRAIEVDLADETPNPAEIADAIVRRAQAAGAASVDEINLDDLGIGGPRLAQAIANATDSIALNPGIQTLFSPSAKVRKIYNDMVDNPVYTKMNMEGRTTGASVENRVKYWQRGVYSSWLREARDLHKQARKAGEKMPIREFMERVGRAMRREDVDADSEFVTKAAQAARTKINDPLLREAQAIKLLPEDVKVDTAPSYFHRMWNPRRLIAEEFRFKRIATDWIRGEMDRLASRDADAQRFLDENDRDSYIEEVVNSVFNKLTGKAFEDVQDWMVPVTRGPLKERTFGIPDELVEDFLEDDAEVVLRRYTRTMGAEVELAGKFGRPDMRDQFAEIHREYEELRKQTNQDNALSSAEKAKMMEKWNKREKQDTTNLTAFRDLIRGTYGRDQEMSAWGPVTRMALAWNYMRLLGGVTLTSIADAMRQVGVHGIRAVMTEALPQLAKGVKGTSMSINEAKELGAVTETILNSRLASLAEINDPYAYGSRYERTIDNATRVFSKLTGLGYWNDAMKAVTSVMTQNRILRNAGKTKLGKHEKTYMAYLGIDPGMAKRIAQQYKKYGQEDGSALVANSHLWDDVAARRSYAAALHKDVDRTIVTKGVADQPLWTRTNWGKIITQFKSFALASHQRILIAGLQERPHRFAEMVVGGTALGMMIAYLKHLERGDMEKANALLENPGLWISDGLDRSGIFSVLFEVSNTTEKLGMPVGITSGLQAAMGDERRDLDVSRYSSRGKIGAVGGPSVGLFEDLATFAGQVSQGDLKRSGVNAAIRQLPYSSLPGVKTGMYLGARPILQDLVE